MNRFDDFIEHHVERAMSNALSIVRDLFTTHTLPPRLTLRYRSSSNHRSEGKLPFYHTIPRCSLPSTKNDFIYYRSRTSEKLSRRRTNADVQYSFSLHQSWSNELNDQPIRHYAEELSSQIISSAVKQIDDDQHVPCSIVLTTFVDRWIDQTIEQAIETMFRFTIEQFIEHFLDEIFTDALSIIAENELSTRRSVTIVSEPIDPMEHLVDHIAQRIYVHSLDSLREIFLFEHEHEQQQSKSNE